MQILWRRQPLLVISPYAKQNYVDHTLTNQASILRFIEDNWNLGRIGDGSFDAVSNSITSMFDFNKGPSDKKLFLDPYTGLVQSQGTVKNGSAVTIYINQNLLTSSDGEQPFMNQQKVVKH